MRRPNARIDVTVTMDQAYAAGGRTLPRPVSFWFAGQLIRVANVVDHWLATNRWWEQEAPSITWRIEDARGGRYELEMQETDPLTWWLRVIYD